MNLFPRRAVFGWQGHVGKAAVTTTATFLNLLPANCPEGIALSQIRRALRAKIVLSICT